MEWINPDARPLTKKEFYQILFGDEVAETQLKKDAAKEFYDKAHHQNNVELIKGHLWYTGNHIFSEFDCSKELKAKQQLEMLRGRFEMITQTPDPRIAELQNSINKHIMATEDYKRTQEKRLDAFRGRRLALIENAKRKIRQLKE